MPNPAETPFVFCYRTQINFFTHYPLEAEKDPVAKMYV